ncbi:hypothetical protein M4S82_10125 [Planococcus sp. MERTA32b]|nr:hypothetical protein [Planococcus sp. MER TA 32b]
MEIEYPRLAFLKARLFFIGGDAIIGIIGLSAAAEDYFRTRLNIVTSILLGAGALLLIVPETYTDIIGLVVVLGIFALNFIKDKRENKPAVSSG